MTGQKQAIKQTIKAIELICLMIGSIVGVGFITGAEIYEVFSRFGVSSFFGVFILFVLLFLLIRKMLMQKFKNEKFDKMYNFQTKEQNYTNNSKLRIKNTFVFLSVLLVSAAMFSGLRELIYQLFNSYEIIIFLTATILIFALVCFGIKGLSKFNLLVIFVLFYVVVVLFLKLDFEHCFVIEQSNLNLKNISLTSVLSMLFVFMNIVEIQPVVDEFQIELSRKTVDKIAFSFAFFMSFIVCLINIFLLKNPKFSSSSMPFMLLFCEIGGGGKIVFVCGLLCGILSTLVACLIGVKQKLKDYFCFNEKISAFLAVILGLVLGVFDFKFFVSFIYPLVGFVNFIVYVFL